MFPPQVKDFSCSVCWYWNSVSGEMSLCCSLKHFLCSHYTHTHVLISARWLSEDGGFGVNMLNRLFITLTCLCVCGIYTVCFASYQQDVSCMRRDCKAWLQTGYPHTHTLLLRRRKLQVIYSCDWDSSISVKVCVIILNYSSLHSNNTTACLVSSLEFFTCGFLAVSIALHFPIM